MTSTTTDRLADVTASLAVKVPVKAATTVAITLEGEQTVDGVAVTDGDRVLVKDQIGAAENGIYVVSTGNWTRAKDFDGVRDVVTGTLVLVSAGGAANGGTAWSVSTVAPITIGTTAIAFTRALYADLPEPANPGDNGKFLTASGGFASWGAALSELSDDTTPQLGGNLDLSGNGIQFPGAIVTDVTGADTTLVSGTAGPNGNLASWNSDGDVVDSGSAVTDIPTQATQASIEAETDEDTYVPPDLLIHHPNVAKFFAYITVSGGTPNLRRSNNVDSFTDTAIGEVAVTIANDFSDVNYAAGCTCTRDAGTRSGHVKTGQSVGSISFECTNSADVKTDPGAWHVWGFGDQ